jgi:hypothetical protein
VEIRAYADRFVIRQDGAVVAEHPRVFGRGQTTYDPWHYVPVPARKPGALRNGAPFKDWVLPAAIERVRRKLRESHDGDRQMVAILSAVMTDGLAHPEYAIAQTTDSRHANLVQNLLDLINLRVRLGKHSYPARRPHGTRGADAVLEDVQPISPAPVRMRYPICRHHHLESRTQCLHPAFLQFATSPARISFSQANCQITRWRPAPSNQDS